MLYIGNWIYIYRTITNSSCNSLVAIYDSQVQYLSTLTVVVHVMEIENLMLWINDLLKLLECHSFRMNTRCYIPCTTEQELCHSIVQCQIHFLSFVQIILNEQCKVCLGSKYLSYIYLIPRLSKLRKLDRLFPIQELRLCRICERLSVTIVTGFSVENTLPLILATSLYGIFYQYIITWDWQWLRTYIQVTCSLHMEIACVVFQVFLHDFEQLFQLLKWDVWLAFLY